MQLSPRLESLVLKTGLHLCVLPDSDRALVLALAACTIEPGQPLREDEVNRRLVDWLADVGQMLRTDHAELRRWLVDAGFVARDDWGHADRSPRARPGSKMVSVVTRPISGPTTSTSPARRRSRKGLIRQALAL